MPQRISDNFEVRRPKLLDNKEGPWSSTAEAIAYITKDIRAQGQVVKILDSGSIVEYWWKDGIEDADLVAKSTGGSGSSLPPGGDAGQLLAKASATDYDVEWIDNYANWTSQLKHEVKLGEAISKGQAVYVSSADGTNMIVSKASNATEGTSSKTLGLLESGGSTNAKVKVITEGLLSGLNTATANAGDPVWLGTSGNLIFGLINKPTAPAHLVFIGVVTRANANNGEIFVKVQNGFELKELHDVQAQSPSGNDTLYFNSGDSQWKTASIPTILGYTPVTNARTLTINGTTLDLTANRSWSVGDLLSSGSYSNPTWLTSIAWTKLTGTPTTLSGYGISSTDTLFDTKYYLATNPSGYTSNAGTVTSVAALTIGTSGTDLSSTVANGTTTPVITLNVPTASASNRGVLSSTDWSTFNGKQNALTNPVTGTGTNNEIAAFNSTGSTITSLSTATYPSLTELSYVKGTTSPIQTQFGLTAVAYTAAVASITSGGSAAETTIQTLTIPAGAFKSGDNILLTIWGARTTGASSGVNSTLTTRITNISGATVIATVTGNRHHNYTITGRCLSDTSIIWWQNSPTTAAATTTVPSLASSGFTLNFSVTRDLNTSEFTLYNAICRKYN